MSSIPELARELRETLERRGITDPRVLDAIEETRRDLFLPESLQYVTVYSNGQKGGFAGSSPVGNPENFRCAFNKAPGALNKPEA